MAFLRKQNLGNFRHYLTSNSSQQIKHHHFCNNTKHTVSHHYHHQLLQQQQFQQSYVKYYSRFSNLFRKSGKNIDVPTSPILFGSLNFSSTSTKSSILSRFRVIEWYLGMIKSRPVLTKSVTSSFIYIAADLTSQVWISFNILCTFILFYNLFLMFWLIDLVLY